jgi:hypothetical protein
MASRAYNLEEFVRILESWGLTDVLLPFILIFVVLFAILQKTRILGENQRRFNSVISLVISLAVVIPHVLGIYPRGGDIVEIINTAIPQVSIIIIAIVMLLLIVGILGGERNWMGGSLSGWVAILAVILILAIFGSAAGWWQGWDWFHRFFGADAVAIVVMLLVFAIIVWWITKGDEADEKAGSLGRLGKSFQDFFSPKK